MKDVHRQIAQFERTVRADLTARRWLRWHAALLGGVCFIAAWGTSASLMHAGVAALALRWPLALGVAYAVFIGLLWCWCRWLLSRDEADGDPGLDVTGTGTGFGEGGNPPFHSGGGGDFGGGGASGSFGDEAVSETASQATSAVFDAAASADEGIVIAVPLAIVVGVALMVASSLGFVVFGLFGVEVLLGVAVEIAIASAGGALAYRARREGWLAHAFKHTIGPAVVLLSIVVACGAAIDRWIPEANSLPQAWRLWHR